MTTLIVLNAWMMVYTDRPLRNQTQMFDDGVGVATTVAATAIIFFCFWMKRNRTKNAGERYPPVSSSLSLLGAILRGGIKVIPDHFMRSSEKLGPVISYNFGGR